MPSDESQSPKLDKTDLSDAVRSAEELELHGADQKVSSAHAAEVTPLTHDDPIQVERETINPNINYGSQLFVEGRDESAFSGGEDTIDAAVVASTPAAADLGTLGTSDPASSSPGVNEAADIGADSRTPDPPRRTRAATAKNPNESDQDPTASQLSDTPLASTSGLAKGAGGKKTPGGEDQSGDSGAQSQGDAIEDSDLNS